MELDEQEHNKLVEADYIPQEHTYGNPVYRWVKQLLDDICSDYRVIDESLHYFCQEQFGGQYKIYIYIEEISDIMEVLEAEEEEEPEVTLDDLQIELRDIEEIINEFDRGLDENGWTWRSPQSISNNTELSVDIVQSILSQNPELFEINSSGLRYRLLISD